MNKIYLVTEGSYSDYRVEAVYSDKKSASLYASGFDDAQVEEYELDPTIPDFLREGYFIYSLYMDQQGNSKYTTKESPKENNIKNINRPYFFNDGEMRINVKARDEKHAVKIANEKRIQILAANRWGDNNVESTL